MARNGKSQSSEDRLTPAQRRLLEAILLGNSVKAAANIAGVPERTAYRWQTDPGFRAELKRAQAEIMDRVLRRLISLGIAATEALARNLRANGMPNVEVRAGTVVLEQIVKLKEITELEARLEAIEQQLNGNAR